VGYESYGMQSDIEHMQYVMENKNYRFNITPLGGAVAKEDRIKMLVPIFEQGRFWMPRNLWFTDYEKERRDYIADFKDDEYLAFPVSVHDDMLDCRARILDPILGAAFPKYEKPKTEERRTYVSGSQGTGWMG
jgi:phage terminase large subunit-like protein